MHESLKADTTDSQFDRILRTEMDPDFAAATSVTSKHLAHTAITPFGAQFMAEYPANALPTSPDGMESTICSGDYGAITDD